MRLRVLQTAPTLGDVDANLTAIDAALGAAQGIDLVVTPELATHGYHLGEVPDARPLDPDDARLTKIGSHGPAVLVGFAERGLHGQYNSAILRGPDVAVVQRKLTLPTYRGWEERKHFIPGGRLRTARVCGATTAILICNDIWQPQLAWLAAQHGAEVLLVPANSSVSEIGLSTDRAWDLLLRGLAVSLQCVIVFVNRVGEEGGREFWGGSAVYGPLGDLLARAGRAAQVLDVELDLGALRELRRTNPLLKESRADVVLRETQRLLEREAEHV